MNLKTPIVWLLKVLYYRSPIIKDLLNDIY